MADPLVVIDPPQLQTAPGGQARAVVTVRNQGRIVDGFRLQVLGAGPTSWARIDPDELRILPGDQAAATVVFSPPAGTPGGSYPFGVLAGSTVDPTTSAAVEGDLDVGGVLGLQARLSPVNSHGRWRARHLVEVTNWGNTAVQLRLTATDPDQHLGFLISPDTLALPVGATAVTELRVRARHPRLRGAVSRSPFQVIGTPDPPARVSADWTPPWLSHPGGVAPPPTVVDGAFTQRPILSRWVVTLLTATAVALAGLAVTAVRRPSPPQPGLTAAAPPDTPALTVTPLDPHSVELDWQGQPNLTGYILYVQTADGKISSDPKLDGAITTHLVDGLQPRTKYCFQLQAARGDQSSLESPRICATTPALPPAAPPSVPATVTVMASPSATGPPTAPAGVFTTTQYIAVSEQVYLESDATAKARAAADTAALPAGTEKPQVLLSTNYPLFRYGFPGGPAPREPTYVVYVGPFDSADQAGAFCAQHSSDWPQGCLVAYPGAAK